MSIRKIEKITKAIINHPDNQEFTKLGWEPVFTAHPAAKILLIAQAPGLKTQKINSPFHDQSGKRLREWLAVNETIFYDPKIFSIMPMDFYFPGKAKHGDLPPRKDFADKWHPLLLSEMPNLKLTILIGSYAVNYYLNDLKQPNLTGYVKDFQKYLPNYFPIIHPSPLNGPWLKKNPWFLEETIPALKKTIQSIID